MKMTDMKTKAKKVFSAYYDDPHHDPTINLTDAFREVINVLQVSPGIIRCPDLLELCEEIEKL
jgi:hypothetical protein